MLPPYLVMMHMKSQDFEWMYHRGFEDINGDIWEIVYMDESSKPKIENPENTSNYEKNNIKPEKININFISEFDVNLKFCCIRPHPLSFIDEI